MTGTLYGDDTINYKLHFTLGSGDKRLMNLRIVLWSITACYIDMTEIFQNLRRLSVVRHILKKHNSIPWNLCVFTSYFRSVGLFKFSSSVFMQFGNIYNPCISHTTISYISIIIIKKGVANWYALHIQHLWTVQWKLMFSKVCWTLGKLTGTQ